jgi:predicted DNA-binding protein
MIKLLKYLAENLQKEDLYNLAMFLSDNPDVIDQETLMHIINDVNDFEMNQLPKELNEKLDKIQEHFKEMD